MPAPRDLPLVPQASRAGTLRVERTVRSGHRTVIGLAVAAIRGWVATLRESRKAGGPEEKLPTIR